MNRHLPDTTKLLLKQSVACFVLKFCYEKAGEAGTTIGQQSINTLLIKDKISSKYDK